MVGAGRVVSEGDGVNTLWFIAKFAPAFSTDAGAFSFLIPGARASDDRQRRSAKNGGLMRKKYYLLVSDFDQTLSFNDSGLVLAEMLGIPDFQEKVARLSRLNLVQSGAELTYLLRHDPDFRRVREDDLIEVGRQIRLKRNIALLAEFLKDGIEGYRFDFYVVSAAPWLVVHSALQGLVPPDHIIGAHFGFSAETGEVESIIQVPAGYGKVAAVDSLRVRLGVPSDRVVYVGDGSSDIHVMLHVNRGEGLTIAASEARHIAQIARRTVISDDALSVLIPILEEIAGFDPAQIRQVFEDQGLLIQEWDRVRTDWLTIRDGSSIAAQVDAA
jgi:2-hydroxy-3-keto-5-methylthiopentenyl-1-phosphate phosphatase